MTGEAYRQSADIARDHGGPFNDYAINERAVPAGHRQAPRRRVRHRRAERTAGRSSMRPGSTWDEALELGGAARLSQRAGHRARAHRHHRVHDGLRHDGHRARHRARQVQEARRRRASSRSSTGTVPMAPRASSATTTRRIRGDRRPTSTSTRRSRERPASPDEHLTVFDCAFKPVNGERSIHYMGHVRMMGATAAVPLRRHQQDRQHARGRHGRGHRGRLPQGWKLGLKAIAIYRDGCKRASRSRPARRRTTRSRPPRQCGAGGSSSLGSPSHIGAACLPSGKR